MEDPVKKLTDLKKLTLENQKLMEEMRTLTRRNRTSLDINAELYKLQAENQKLTEEVLSLTKKNNTLLAFQSRLYEKRPRCPKRLLYRAKPSSITMLNLARKKLGLEEIHETELEKESEIHKIN